MSVAAAQKDLEALEAALADVRNRIAPFRRALYDVREQIRSACLDLDVGRMQVRSWRAPSRDEIAWLDARTTEFLEKTEHLIPEENRLKTGVAEAKNALRNAEYEAGKAARDATRRSRITPKRSTDGQHELF